MRNHRTTIPKSKDGAVEALRILRITRDNAVRERRSALQLLRMSIRNLTRMQLIRTLAAWRPDVSNATDPVTAYRVSLKTWARRYLELTDEIVGLDELINPIVEPPHCSNGPESGSRLPARCSSPPVTTPNG